MQDNLVGYLLDALNVEETTLVERLLATDDKVLVQLETLRLALAPLETDREQVDAPQGLAARTCRKVRELQNERST